MRQRAFDAAVTGIGLVTPAGIGLEPSAADAAARSVSEADLGGHASRITEDVTERLKEVAEDVVTTAFDPSRNPTAK